MNLGCGHRYHPNWTNVSNTNTGKGVVVHDLRRGIPFPSSTYDVVYHSHLLEHFSVSLAKPFLKECLRVLRPEGVIRIAVPDLEQIVQEYLSALALARAGSQDGRDRYKWIMLELYDQTVRNQSGGEMAKYLQQEHLPNEAYILQRIGMEAQKIIATKRLPKMGRTQTPTLPKCSFSYLFQKLSRLLRDSKYRREVILQRLLGEEYLALQIGRFREGGEVHQWMYDSYSLKELLTACGFHQVVQRTATESSIPNWSTYHLDMEPDGTIYKPDSLYMEALKP
jgi:predicted SAM-dependent methyltransferase